MIDDNPRRLKQDPDALVGPPVTAHRGKSGKGVYGNEFAFYDKAGNEVAQIVYSPDKPPPAPARPTVRARTRGTETGDHDTSVTIRLPEAAAGVVPSVKWGSA